MGGEDLANVYGDEVVPRLGFGKEKRVQVRWLLHEILYSLDVGSASLLAEGALIPTLGRVLDSAGAKDRVSPSVILRVRQGCSAKTLAFPAEARL